MLNRVTVITDTDLDGVASAIIIAKYYEIRFNSWNPLQKKVGVFPLFPERSELDEWFGDEAWCKGTLEIDQHLYLCDTCPNTEEACRNIGTILAPKLTIFDHHTTYKDRLSPYIMNFSTAPGKGLYIEEGDRCSTSVAFDKLRVCLDSGCYEKFNRLKKFVSLVNDYDLWHRKVPRSTELADFVTDVGPEIAYKEFMKIAENPGLNTPLMDSVIQRVALEKEKSLALGKATLVKHKGYKVPFATCLVDDYASYVGSELVANTGIIAMFDVARKTLSFRVGPRFSRTKSKKPNCLDFAEPLGGGGHPYASGVSTNEALPAFKEMSHALGVFLLEVEQNERRSRSSADRKVS